MYGGVRDGKNLRNSNKDGMKTQHVITQLKILNCYLKNKNDTCPDPKEISKVIDRAVELLSGMLGRSKISKKT